MANHASRFLAVLSGVALGLAGYGALAADGQTGLVFGSVAMDIPTVMHKRLKPLTDYLSRELKQPVKLSLSQNMRSAEDAVVRGEVDISYLTPVAYINVHERGDVRLVAKLMTNGSSTFRLMIAVRGDSPIHSVADLKGKRFAFGDPAALMQKAVVVGAGIPIEELGSVHHLGHYDNVARGVANGDFDAGILKDTTAFEWEKKGLRVIHASPEIPPFNIVVSRRVGDTLYNAIRTAFLQLDAKNPDHAAVIKALDPAYDGFAPATDADYDATRKLIRPFRQKK